MPKEVFYPNKGGVEKENPYKLEEQSEKAEAYSKLAKKEGLYFEERADEDYQKMNNLLSGEQLRQKPVFQGEIDKYNPNKPAFDKEGNILKRDSLYLILVDFFRECYEESQYNKDLAHKEALMALAYLTEQKINVDRIPANGMFKIEHAKLSISTGKSTDWDMCDSIPLIKSSPKTKMLRIDEYDEINL